MVDTAEQMSKKTYDWSESRFAKPMQKQKTHRAWRYRKRSTFKTTFGHGGPETWR